MGRFCLPASAARRRAQGNECALRPSHLEFTRSFIANNIFVVGPGANFMFADQPPAALPAFRGNV
jgi:hypothetical protein